MEKGGRERETRTTKKEGKECKKEVREEEIENESRDLRILWKLRERRRAEGKMNIKWR